MALPDYLYHYYELENGPFRNIMEDGKEKAAEIQRNITEGWNSKRNPNYIPMRFALEKRLKNKFTAKGGKPTRDTPFYFTLGECSWINTWYVKPGLIKIPLADFNAAHLSFTYPDSFISFQIYDGPQFSLYRKDYNGQVYLLNEMDDLIKTYGLPSDEKALAEERMKFDRYIEVQVWDDLVISKYKNNSPQ